MVNTCIWVQVLENFHTFLVKCVKLHCPTELIGVALSVCRPNLFKNTIQILLIFLSNPILVRNYFDLFNSVDY